LEYSPAQGGAIELVIRLQYLGAKVRSYLRQSRATRLDHPACGVVGIYGVYAQRNKVLGGGAFAATDTAG
jgi:hypothetical protein